MISPTQSYAAPTSNAIYIRGGLEGAKNYPVTPGYTAWLIDEENKKFFMKFVNSSGIPTIKEFKYEEVETPDTQASSGESSKYVLKEDFDKLYKKIEKLEKSLDKRNNYKHNNYRRNGNGKSYGKPV